MNGDNTGLKGKRLQYYLVSNKTGNGINTSDFWDWLKKMK